MSSVVTALRSFVVGSGAIAVVKAPPGSGKTYTLVEALGAVDAS
jgi:superfamily II DNA or RNA helicase